MPIYGKALNLYGFFVCLHLCFFYLKLKGGCWSFNFWLLKIFIRVECFVVIIYWFGFKRYVYNSSGVLYSKTTRLLLGFIRKVRSHRWNVWKCIKWKLLDKNAIVFIWNVQPWPVETKKMNMWASEFLQDVLHIFFLTFVFRLVLK